MRTIELFHWMIQSADSSFNIDKQIYKIIESDYLFFAEKKRHKAYHYKRHSFRVHP